MTVQAQTAPTGYTLVADNDYIDAGPLTNVNQTIASLQACADACDQDALCQSIQFTTVCFMYRLRRCMTPPVHDNSAPLSNLGPIYEKNSPVPIPAGSQIDTICGNYSGPVLDSYTTTVPAEFGPKLDANVAAFKGNCSQQCGDDPSCRSWRVLQIYENNPRIPVVLRCTSYADSIYDVPNHGFFSNLAGCKRARSTIAIKGPAVSLFNCTAPGTGASV